MTATTLRHPVFDLDGHVLLTAGTPLTEGVLEELSSKGGQTRYPRRSLMRHGSVRRDLDAMIHRGAYGVIFGDPSECAGLFRMMARTRLPLPVLEALDYFRKEDQYTYSHTLMVFALSCLLAQRLGGDFRDEMMDITAGPLHDYGKICVPLSILRKTSPLERTERDFLEHHTMAGWALLRYYLGRKPGEPAAAVARDHHERKDGSGYPRGIRLRNRLVEVIAACDVYDALISPRPYRKKSFDNRTALEMLTEMANRGKIGWGVVRALVASNRKDKPRPEACDVSFEKRGTPPGGNLYGIFADDPTPPMTAT